MREVQLDKTERRRGASGLSHRIEQHAAIRQQSRLANVDELDHLHVQRVIQKRLQHDGQREFVLPVDDLMQIDGF